MDKFAMTPVSSLLNQYTSSANVKLLQTQSAGGRNASEFPVMEVGPARGILDYLQRNGIDYQLNASQYYTKRSSKPKYEIAAKLANSGYKVTLFSSDPKSVGNVFIGSGRIYPTGEYKNLYLKGSGSQKNQYAHYNTKTSLGYMIVNNPAVMLTHVLNRSKSSNFTPEITSRGVVNSTLEIPVRNSDGSVKTYTHKSRNGKTYTDPVRIYYQLRPNTGHDLNLLRPDIIRDMAKTNGYSYDDVLNKHMNAIMDPKAKNVSPSVKVDRNALATTISTHSGFQDGDPAKIMQYVNGVRKVQKVRFDIMARTGVYGVEHRKDGSAKFTPEDIKIGHDYMNGDEALENIPDQDHLSADQRRYVKFYRQHVEAAQILANRDAFSGHWRHNGSLQTLNSRLTKLDGAQQAQQEIKFASATDSPQKAGLTAPQIDLFRYMSNQSKKAVDKAVAKDFLNRTIFNSKFYYLRKSFGDKTMLKGTPVAQTQKNLAGTVKDNRNTITENDAQTVYNRLNEVFGSLKGYSDNKSLFNAIENGNQKGDRPLTQNQQALLHMVATDANTYIGDYEHGFDPNNVINLSNEAVGGYMRNYIYTALSTVHYPNSKFKVNGMTREQARLHPEKGASIDFTTLSKVEDHVLTFDPDSATSAEDVKNPFLKQMLGRIQQDLLKYQVRGNKTYNKNGNSLPKVSIDKNGVVHWQGYRRYRRYVGHGKGAKYNRYDKITEPIEGQIGQIFAPNGKIIHTNFASKDNLTKIPAFKGYYQPNDPRPGFSTPRRERLRFKGFYQMMDERVDYGIASQLLRQPPKDVTYLHNPANIVDVTSSRDPVMFNGIYHSEVYGKNLSGDSQNFFKQVNGKPVVGRTPLDLKAVIETYSHQVHFPKNLDDLDSASARNAKHFKNPTGDLLSGHNLRTVAATDYAGIFDPRQSGNGTSQGINLYLDKGIDVNNDINDRGKLLHPADTIDIQSGKHVPATGTQIKKNAQYLAHRDLNHRVAVGKQKGESQQDVLNKLSRTLNQYVSLEDGFYSPKLKRRIKMDKVTPNGHFNSKTMTYSPSVLDVLTEVHKLDTISQNKDGTYNYVIPRSPLRSLPQFRYDRYNMGDRSLMAAHYALTAPHSQKARVSLVTTGGFTYDDSCTVNTNYAIKNPQINAFDKDGVGFRMALQHHFEQQFNTDSASELAKMVIAKQKYDGDVPYTQYVAKATNANKLINYYVNHHIYTKAQALNHVSPMFNQKTSTQLNQAMLNDSQGRLNPKTAITQINKMAQIAGLDQIHSHGKLTKFVFSEGPNGTEARVFDPKRDANVNRNQVDPVGFNALGDRTRPLRKGDKMIEYAGNKATIGAVVDPNMPADQAKAAGFSDIVDFYKHNPDLDMTMSPFSVVSRDNTGLIHEMHANGHVEPINVKDPNSGKWIQRGQSGVMNMMVADIPVDTKTQDYNAQKVQEGRGRNVNGQIGWALQAFHADHILHAFYAEHDSQFNHYRNFLNVVGSDIVEDKHHHLHYTNSDPKLGYVRHHNLGKAKLDEHRQIFTADKSLNSRYVKFAGTPEQFTKLMSGRSGILKLPFKVRLFSGIKTDRLTIIDSSMRRNMISRDGTMSLNDYMSNYKKIYTAAQKYIDEKKAITPGLSKSNRNYLTRHANAQKTRMINSINQLQADVTEKELGGFDGSQQKDSFIRRQIIETRVPNSSTSVVTADPRVRLGHVKVGRRQYRTILGKGDPNYIGRKGRPMPIWKVIQNKTNALNKAKQTDPAKAKTMDKNLKQYKKTHARVLMWRDPALTEGSIRGVQLDMDPSINGVGAAMPPLTDDSFEGDFDGDTYGLVAIPHANDPKIQHDLDHISVQHNLVNNFNSKPASYLNISMDAVNGAVNKGIVPKTRYLFDKKSGQWLTGPKYANKIANMMNQRFGTKNLSAQDWAKKFRAVGMNSQQGSSHQAAMLKNADKLNYLANDYERNSDGSFKLDAKSNAVAKPLVLEQYAGQKKAEPSAKFMTDKNGNYVRDKNGFAKMTSKGTSKDMLQAKFLDIMKNKKLSDTQKVDNTQSLADECMRMSNYASAYVNIEDPKRVGSKQPVKDKAKALADDRAAQDASIQNSCDTGAKGNSIKRMNRFRKFNWGLGTRKDLQDVQFAKGSQADMTGIAGSYSQAIFSLLRHKDPVTAMEITHPDTQAVLQIKHNPEQARSYKKWLTGPMKQVLVNGSPILRSADGEVMKKNDGIAKINHHGLQTASGFKRDYGYIMKQLGISPNPKLLDNLTKDISIKDRRTGKHLMIGAQKMMQIESDPLDRNAYGRHAVAIPKVFHDKQGNPEVETTKSGDLVYPESGYEKDAKGNDIVKYNKFDGLNHKVPKLVPAGGVSSLFRATRTHQDLQLTDYETDDQRKGVERLDRDAAAEYQLDAIDKAQAKQTAAQAPQQTTQKSAQQATQKPVQKLTQQTAQKPTQQPAQKPAQPASQASAEAAPANSAQQSAETKQSDAQAAKNKQAQEQKTAEAKRAADKAAKKSREQQAEREARRASHANQTSDAPASESSSSQSSATSEQSSEASSETANPTEPTSFQLAFAKSKQMHKNSGSAKQTSNKSKSKSKSSLWSTRHNESMAYRSEVASMKAHRADAASKQAGSGKGKDGPDDP